MTLGLRLIYVASSDTVAARSDPEAQPLTAKQLKSMLPIKALLESQYVARYSRL